MPSSDAHVRFARDPAVIAVSSLRCSRWTRAKVTKMLSNTRLAAFLAVAALSLTPAERSSASPQKDRVDVVVYYSAMPDEAERARTAALGAWIRWESDIEPVRGLSVPAQSLAAIRRGTGVRQVTLNSEAELPAPAP